jgi:ABC-type Zn2+ transport system substrate-binding protein/surface adhesin
MAISPLGNIVLVNQMTPAATAPQNAHNNRVELQNFMTQAMIQEKDEKVLEIREAEESHAIDPDREHQQQHADEQTKEMSEEAKQKPHKKEQEQDVEENEPKHLLDIKV